MPSRGVISLDSDSDDGPAHSLTSSPPRPPSVKSQHAQRPIEKRPRSKADDRETVLRTKRQARIQAAFEKHEQRGATRNDEIEVLVSPSLYKDGSKMDVLKEVRVMFPGQLVEDTRKFSNLVSWRRKKNHEQVPVSVFVFEADHFLEHLDSGTLDQCVQHVVSERSGTCVIFAVSGIERRLQTRNRQNFRKGKMDKIYQRSALQDCYRHLDTEYGIRVHIAANHEELAHTIRDWSEAVAKAPYHKDEEFLAATLQYRTMRTKGAASPVAPVTAAASHSNCGISDGEGGEMDIEKPLGPHIRSGPSDAGCCYLSMIRMIPGVSIDKVRAIRERYPSMLQLMDAYAACSSDEERNALLANLKFGRQGRRLGPHLSRVIAAVLNEEDGTVSVMA